MIPMNAMNAVDATRPSTTGSPSCGTTDASSGTPRPAARSRGGLRRVPMIVALLVACGLPQSASAWPCRWRAGGWGFGYGAVCARPFAYRPFCGFGYGFSSYSYRSFSYGVPGFVSSCWYPWYPSFGYASCYAPCATWAPCVTASPYGFSGVGCGWYPFTPVVGRPIFGGFPSAIAPVYGPAGVAPFLGFGAATAPAVDRIAGGPPAAAPLAAAARALANRRLRDGTLVRTSNPLARLRADRLVAVGDRHMRASVAEPGRLLAALDAYRRAATIAPDMPDTFLRQAIVLTALDRRDDAGDAVDRAVAIDARLEDGVPAMLAGDERPPPDPVFGDRPAGEPPTLASRSGRIVRSIFAEGGREPAAADNWIADRWSRQWQDRLAAVANR